LLRYDTYQYQYHTFMADDVLTVVPMSNSLKASWKCSFQHHLDDGSWCDIHKGPSLWKVELHTTTNTNTNPNNNPCTLVFALNHAISDQSSANRLLDQLLRCMAEIKSGSVSSASPPHGQDMPVAFEDSILGLQQCWNDVKMQGFLLDTIRYIAGKAAEGLRNPVILPDCSINPTKTTTTSSSSSNSVLGTLTIISGNMAGGVDTQE